jgi:hypothetical protein
VSLYLKPTSAILCSSVTSDRYGKPANLKFRQWQNEVDELVGEINQMATFPNDSKYRHWADEVRLKVRALQSRGVVFATYEETKTDAHEHLDKLQDAEISMSAKRPDPFTAYQQHILAQDGLSKGSKSKEGSDHGDGSLSPTGSLGSSSSPDTVIL